MREERPVIIVGGGIAGIAAALHLAEHGRRVTLLETRTKLGGRATSFVDVRTGEAVDNCQHLAMGCCTNYLDLCRRLGVLDQIEWTHHTTWIEPGGRTSVLSRSLMPAPGHFGPSFLGVRFLDASEKVSLAACLGAALREDRRRHKGITLREWLLRHDQSPRVIDRFWSPVIVSACNLTVDRVCAATALHVFQEGFFAHRDAASIGVSRVPLARLYDRAEATIAAAGGEVRLSSGVERVWADRVLTTSGRTLEAESVVLAVPPERAARLIAPELAGVDPRFAAAGRITHSPILGVHLIFDRPVLTHPHAVLVDRPTQWLFRKDERGTKIHAVISAADDWVPLNESEITRRVVEDLHACIPASRAARVIASRPVKEKLATFAPTPEVERVRPGVTGASGVFLAGDWVSTGWPATMEGAARSGAMAAAAVLGLPERSLLRPPLQAALLARALATAPLHAD
ncbi:MAG: FAD-dependent oxidoreductase [Planctomycetes bacterium]|nr:FAD-dependent oxidoreductase [Planctomycetota bacterium]